MNDRIYLPVIAVVSVAVPLLVAFLIFMPRPEVSLLGEYSFLPALNAIINSSVTVLLILAYSAIRRANIRLHKTLMLSALILSALFLVSYILYHSGPGHVVYNGQGAIRMVYFFILISHILLSVAVVPLALVSLYRGLGTELGRQTEIVKKHRRISKITFPIWLYVAVTGVIVYFMAHPFNPAVV